MNLARMLPVLVAAMFCSGCASITRGSKEVLVIDSTPQDADVRLSTGMVGKTPASFQVPRSDTITVFITKPGYKDRTIIVQAEIGGGGGAAMAGNVFVGGFIGAGIDAGTGAMYEHKPNPLMVTLEKIDAPAATPPPSEDGKKLAKQLL
jgi:hypothetical protein